MFNLEKAIKQWKRKLASNDFKVGVVWSGNPKHGDDHRRSCPLERFSALAQIEGAQLYSLQKGAAAEELARLNAGGIVEDISGAFEDLSDTAGAVANLDLIISVDTVVGHLAGAMGRAVWVLLPEAPDWRWMLDREDSLWYPTMRLFRQERRGDWDGVFARVRGELERLIGNGPGL